MAQQMDIKQAVEDLRKDIESLSVAHRVMLSSQKKLGQQLEIARSNIEILQQAVVDRASLPTDRMN